MAIEFKLPELGENIESADVAEILVAEGDMVDSEQIVMELETEKAVVELPCPHAGKITRIHVAEGDSINVGSTVLTIEESVDAKVTADNTDVSSEKPVRDDSSSVAEATSSQPRAANESAKEATAGATRIPSSNIEREGIPAPAGPATRRFARELGVDLQGVVGTGPSGRISREDVQAHVRSLGSTATHTRETASPRLPDFALWGEVERRPLGKIAKSSAENLSVAWRTIPHVTQHDLADVTELEAARRRFVQKAEPSAPKVTMTAILMKAVVGLLQEFPHFNASLDSQAGELVLKKYYHIGVAVDTPNGLLVPAVRHVDRKSILDLAADLTDLAERARGRNLKVDEMQGASFTITNLGGIGGTAFTPIVNYPEVAILGVSRTRTELRLVDDRPQERLMLPLSLSYDHRVINGADAARFVVRLTHGLSDYFQILVEC